MSTRQSGDMTSKLPISPVSEAHARHDHILVAALASGDVAGLERKDAEALLSTCESCRLLHDDLRLLAGAVRQLFAETAPPDQDFRLSADDARRLTRGGWLRRLIRPFGEARRSVIRPFAGAMVALGLAVVVLSGPSLMLFGGAAGGATGAPTEAAYRPSGTTSIQDQASPSASGVGVGGTDSTIGAPTTTGAPTDTGAPRSTNDGGAKESTTESTKDSSRLQAIGERIPWSIIGVTLVVTGLAVLVLRRVALRLR